MQRTNMRKLIFHNQIDLTERNKKLSYNFVKTNHKCRIKFFCTICRVHALNEKIFFYIFFQLFFSVESEIRQIPVCLINLQTRFSRERHISEKNFTFDLFFHARC